MLVSEAHDRLEELLAERAVRPTDDLETEIAAVRADYVGLAVTEIALLRSALGGTLQG